MCYFLSVWDMVLCLYLQCCRPLLQCQGLWYNSSLGRKPENNRTVCAAEEAGYVEYHGLPGMVKIGCMNTPIQTSTFCALHKLREMKTESESSVCAQSRGTQHRVIESILQEKQTGNGKYYQVSNCYYHPGISTMIIIIVGGFPTLFIIL